MFDLLNLFKWIDQGMTRFFDALAHLLHAGDDIIEDMSLMEDEEILCVTQRHWGLLLRNLILPFLIVFLSGGLAFYRAIGGSFLVSDAVYTQEFDLVNRLLMAGVALLLLLFGISRWRSPKRPNERRWLLVVAAFLALVIYFRYQGGRILYISPLGGEWFDTFNIVLLAITLCGLWLALYLFVNWANDQLVLTNKRVVREDEEVFIPRLIERRTQDQLPIGEIQNVVASTDSYLKHWFSFGTVIIQSATVGHRIIFEAARNPKEIQGRIDAEVRKLRSSESDQNFEKMIEERVYNNGPPRPKRLRRTESILGPPIFRRLLEENPKYDEAKDTYQWYPHWLFLIQALIAPVVLLFAGMIAILITMRLELLSWGWGVFAGVLLVLVFIGWSAWEVEDYRNDRYILTPTNVIDIYKLPFGPEKRVTASLGALQNVSFKTTFWGNLIGYGDVILTTAGSGADFTFLRVPNPRGVVATVNDYLLDFKRGEKERSLDDALTLLRYYHEAQKRHNEIRAENP